MAQIHGIQAGASVTYWQNHHTANATGATCQPIRAQAAATRSTSYTGKHLQGHRLDLLARISGN